MRKVVIFSRMKSSFLLLSFLLLIFTSSPAADLTVSGNLDVRGNIMNLGSWKNQTNQPGLSLNYTDSPNNQWGDFHFSLNRLTSTWLWEHVSPNKTWLPMMKLNSDNSLSLFNSLGQSTLSLNPNGSSVFQNSVTINGNNTLLPSQTLTSDGSALTRKLGDGRYVVKGSDKTALGYATASASSATAMGGDSLASGDGAIAGGESIATGIFAVALGEDSIASGNSAIALGNQAQAQGNSSFAAGNASQSQGKSSTAIGEMTVAQGSYAAAFGLSTIAQGYNQTVIGRYNIAQGNTSNWVVTDDLFIVGNGTSINQRSNAFTVRKNGDAIVKGNATINGGAYVQGYFTSKGLSVEGPAEIMSDTSIEGNLIVGGSIFIAPQGDIPMGEFK